MSSWDDEDYEAPSSTVSNGALQACWEGEDEEVADAWDEEDESEKKEGTEGAGATTVQKKPRRRNLQEVIAEKEAKRLADLAAKKAALAEAEAEEQMTPEQIRRAQEESDLMLAKDTFGVSEAPVLTELERSRSIDEANPQSKDDFDRLRGLLRDKLLPFEKSPHFPGFLDSLLREITTNQDVECLKRLSTMLGAMANEKVRLQRSKAKKKGAAKGKIATIRDNDFENDVTQDLGDDFDDFM